MEVEAEPLKSRGAPARDCLKPPRVRGACSEHKNPRGWIGILACCFREPAPLRKVIVRCKGGVGRYSRVRQKGRGLNADSTVNMNPRKVRSRALRECAHKLAVMPGIPAQVWFDDDQLPRAVHRQNSATMRLPLTMGSDDMERCEAMDLGTFGVESQSSQGRRDIDGLIRTHPMR